MTQEKKSRRFWIAMILGFFAIDLTIAVIAITMAAGDPSFRSIPGFSQRSVHWAESQRRQQTLQNLGWTISVNRDLTSHQSLVVDVVDAQGAPVKSLDLKLTLFHYTRVAEQQITTFAEKDGHYFAEVHLQKPGLWHLDLTGVAPDGKEVWTQIKLDQDFL